MIEIARFFRYYCNVSAKKRLEKCVELLAHDCASLVYRAFALRRVYHEELLRIFLTFDDMKEVRRFKSCLHGVRRAQVKLATNYLVDGEEEFAKRIRDDMDVEDSSTLQGLWEEIVSLNRRDFWEITDRGSNVNYLSTLQMNYLKQFFSMFESTGGDSESLDGENGGSDGQVLRSISSLQTVFSERSTGAGTSSKSLTSESRRADDALRKVDSDGALARPVQEEVGVSQKQDGRARDQQGEGAAMEQKRVDGSVADNEKHLLDSINRAELREEQQAPIATNDSGEMAPLGTASNARRFKDESRVTSTQRRGRR